MPNHIENILILNTNFVDLEKIVGNNFSFTHVVPEPPGENPDWYNWRCRFWGTKWDAYDVEEEQNEVNDKGEIIVQYRFNTAWSPPNAWLSSVAEKFPNTNLTLYWSDEDLPQSGWIKYIDRIKTEENFSHLELEIALNFLKEQFPDKYNMYLELRSNRNDDSHICNEDNEAFDENHRTNDPFDSDIPPCA